MSRVPDAHRFARPETHPLQDLPQTGRGRVHDLYIAQLDRCPLADDWRAWGTDRRADRLFMVCPSCGVLGCHVR